MYCVVCVVCLYVLLWCDVVVCFEFEILVVYVVVVYVVVVWFCVWMCEVDLWVVVEIDVECCE